MASTNDQGTQLRTVEDSLIRRYGDRFNVEVIRHEVRVVAQELSDARVQTFIPVLIERRVAESLRHSV